MVMPSATPLRKSLSSRKEAKTHQRAKGSSPFSRDEHACSSQSHSTSRFSLTRFKSTLFEKTYFPSPLKFTNRITKSKGRRKITEVERCKSMEQREQYRQLIEQYRTTTLAETEQIFCRSTGKPNSSSQNIALPVINLCEMPNTSTKETSQRNFIATHQPSPTSFKSFHRSPTSCQVLGSEESKLKDLNSVENKSSSKNVCVPSSSRLNSSPAPSGHHNINLSSSSALHTPNGGSAKIDWFSPSSPYLCKTFVTDLMNTYGRRERDRKRMLVEEETRARLLKEKRETKDKMLAEMLEKRLHFSTEDDVEVIPELTPEMEDAVKNALIPYPQGEVLAESFNISITRQHMSTLAGLNWLNDEIINYYMELIVQRSKEVDNLPDAHAMNTFFYPKLSTQGYRPIRRWTKKVDIFSKKLIFFPIHLGVHWTLAVADFRSKEITYYDSMGGSNHKCLETIKMYLASEHLDKKKTSYDVSDWKTTNMSPDEIPQQLNGSDCGVFTCTFAEFISRKATLSFTQDDMPLIRLTMIWEILQAKLTR
ncbi:unnamed protein product [Clavelina lepadiformis]|uniref:Ubiquitin-like protease family profile domain-containing protein n=1 Tax=Clavelina lepadiformis TaxID=159417 RepID=A0ABP0GAH0_CLALP